MAKGFRQIKPGEWRSVVVKGKSLLFKKWDPKEPEHFEAKVTVVYAENDWALAKIDEFLVKGSYCRERVGSQVFVQSENIWVEEK